MHQHELIEVLNRVHDARVLVIGDLMLDRFVYGAVNRISPEGPIPVFEVDRLVDSAGGAANVARNVAGIGAKVTLIGVTGDDLWAEHLRGQIAMAPSIEARLVMDSARPTTVKTRYVADGQQVLRADREVRAPMSEDVEARVLGEIKDALAYADVVVLSDYAKGLLSNHVTRTAILAASEAGKRVIVDPKAKDFRKYLGPRC